MISIDRVSDAQLIAASADVIQFVDSLLVTIHRFDMTVTQCRHVDSLLDTDLPERMGELSRVVSDVKSALVGMGLTG